MNEGRPRACEALSNGLTALSRSPQSIRLQAGRQTIPRERTVPAVLVYAVVSAETEQAVELFPDREQAEAFIAEVEQDEPDTAEPDRFSASTN
jgi:hypothetical protein